MKALSLSQPFASLIASGRKTIETRTWSTSYRGPLLICSAKRPTNQGPVGVALAIVDVVDCRPMTTADVPAACCPLYPGACAWALANIRRIVEPFPVKGTLGLFHVEVPVDVRTEAVSGGGEQFRLAP